MAPAAATTLFGGSASQTTTPSQGTIMLFTDPSCESPLASNPTPLLYGDCFTVPLTGIKGISVSSFPSCPDYGTPLLLVSDVGSCENSTQGTGADSGVTGECQSFSSGVDVKSAQFACFGRGISPAAASATAAPTTSQVAEAPTATTTTTAAAEEGEDGNGEESGDDDYDDDEEEEEAPGITINGRISVSTRIVAWTVATGRGGTGIGLAEQLLLLQLSIRGWR